MNKILIKNADWIITMDPERRRLRNSDILIEGKAIKAIGKNLVKEEEVDQVIDASGKFIIPGLVNTHHHCWQSLARNVHVCNGITLEPWLDVIYNLAMEVTPVALDAATHIGLGELLKTGCTTSMDHHYVFPTNKAYKNSMIDVQIGTAEKLGMRFHPTRGSITIGQAQGSHVPDVFAEDEDDVLADSERLLKTYHSMDNYSMCRLGLAPTWHGFDSTARLMEESLQLARKFGAHCHSHLAESRAEVTRSIEKFGCRPVEHVRRLGWLGEDIYYAHCVQLNDEEVKLFAETGTGVAHCPKSNMFLNSGVSRVPEIIRAGGNVGLGVDGAASNNDSNMLQEMRVSYLAHMLLSHERGGGMTSEEILAMATLGGAKVLGRDDIGHLAPDMAADLVIVDWDKYQFAGGKNDPVACMILSGDRDMIDTVLVNGEIVVKEGTLVKVNEDKVKDWVNQVGKDMLRRASVRVDGLKKDL